MNDYISVPSSLLLRLTPFIPLQTTAGSGRDYLFDGATSTNSARSLIALRNAGKVQFWAGNWANSNLDSPTDFFTISACLTIPPSYLTYYSHRKTLEITTYIRASWHKLQ